MDEFRQYLGSDCDQIARGKQPGECDPRIRVFGVFHHFGRNEKAGVKSMVHGRPSSISPSKSSSSGRAHSTAPRLMVGMSKTLCGCKSSLERAVGAVPCP